METTAPPPPPPPASAAGGPRPGQLTPLWRFSTAGVWILAFVAWSGVWKASRELGVSTWWLGPDGDPAPIFVMLLPFVAPVVMVLLALNNIRRLPLYGLIAAGACAVIGIADLSYVRRLGVVELVIAGSGAAMAVAGFAGMYRRPRASPADAEAPPAAEVELEGAGPNAERPR